jgi:hypothetical protein
MKASLFRLWKTVHIGLDLGLSIVAFSVWCAHDAFHSWDAAILVGALVFNFCLDSFIIRHRLDCVVGILRDHADNTADDLRELSDLVERRTR